MLETAPAPGRMLHSEITKLLRCHLMVQTFDALCLSPDRVEQQQFRVDMGSSSGGCKPGAALQQGVSCFFSRTPDLLFVLLPREVHCCFSCRC